MSQFMDMIRLPNYGLGIAKGQFSDISHVHKFGATPQMSINTTGTIWDVSDTLYPWSVWDSGASQLDIVCASANDVGLTLHVFGLDSNYELISESTEVTSQTGQTTTNSYIRVNRAYVTNTVNNEGNISLQYSGTVVARLLAGQGQTMMAIYTVPEGHTGYIVKGVSTCEANADGSGFFYAREFGLSSFRVQHSFELGLGNQYDYQFTIPLNMPAKTDLDVRVLVRSNNSRVTAAFDIILDND